MRTLIFPSILALLIACNLPTFYGAPDDFSPWHGTHTDQDTTLLDTIPPDTTIQDSIITDTCTEYVHITDPAFVTGYMTLDEAIQTDVTIIVGPYSAVVPEDHLEQVQPILDSLLRLYHPEYTYDVQIRDGTDPRATSYIVKGTSDPSIFTWSVQMRLNGYKVYPGAEERSLQFVGARSWADCMALAQALPSAIRFSCYGTSWDSTQYVQYALTILHEDVCKAGELWADFRHNAVPIPQWIVDLYDDRDWGLVLHAPAYALGPVRVDLRDMDGVTDDDIKGLLSMGYQVIVRDRDPVLSPAR